MPRVVSTLVGRTLTALFGALEALLVVAIGVGIPLVPLTIVWGTDYGFGVDWTVFWRVAADAWLAGHGVDLTLALDPAIAGPMGLPGADAPVVISIAALGFALLTVLMGARAGRRIGESPHRITAWAGSVAAFGVASTAIALSAQHPSAWPSLWQGILLPTLVYAAGVLLGALRPSPHREPVRLPVQVTGWLNRIPTTAVRVASTAARLGLGALAAVFAIAAVITTLALFFSFAEIITLYEGLHTGVSGGVMVTLGQLAMLPDAVMWTTSWLLGPGFAVGDGSVVSPVQTLLGPIPALPILGALPSGELPFAFLGLLVPLVCGFLLAAFVAPGVARAVGGSRALLAATGAGAGLVAGIAAALLALASSGSAGPGRLAVVGPDPLAVGVCAAIEIGFTVVLGLLVGARRSAPVVVESAAADRD
jgi:hypothetical protein